MVGHCLVQYMPQVRLIGQVLLREKHRRTKEMSRVPSLSPSLLPTGQPVVEAPPEDIPEDSRIPSSAKWVLSVLAVVVGAVALAVFLTRRHHNSHTPPQPVSKSETSDTENPSAAVPPNEDNRRPIEATEEVVAQEDRSEDDNESETVTHQYERAQRFFPSLDLHPDTIRNTFDGTHGGLEGYLLNHIQTTLREMNDATREDLLKRKNANKLCLALGMDEEIVQIKFEANRKFVELTGIDFKAPILDSIHHLIHDLGYDNPFGDANDRIERSYQGRGNISYRGVEINPNNFLKKINLLEEELANHGYGQSFMHGTTATTLKMIRDNTSLTPNNSRHDFGPGLYCFKGKLVQALSYSFDRSWPDPGSRSKGKGKGKPKKINIANITKDNPSVAIFPEAKTPANETFNVGVTKYPYNNDDLRELIPDAYKTFDQKQKEWKAEDFEWKKFVKLARSHDIRPDGYKVFYGWLHDSDHSEGTKNCREPVVEKDRWVQYCFTKTDGRSLGIKKIFIELHLDWAQWVGQASTVEELKKDRKALIGQVTREAST